MDPKLLTGLYGVSISVMYFSEENLKINSRMIKESTISKPGLCNAILSAKPIMVSGSLSTFSFLNV